MEFLDGREELVIFKYDAEKNVSRKIVKDTKRQRKETLKKKLSKKKAQK